MNTYSDKIVISKVDAEQLGMLLRTYRINLGLSFIDISRYLYLSSGYRVSPSDICKRELGKIKITIGYLSAYCKALSISISLRLMGNGKICITSFAGAKCRVYIDAL